MTTSQRLGITASTLGNPPFAELVPLIAKAGLTELSIWPKHTYTPALATMTDADMRSLLADNGVSVHDVDALVAWVGPDDPGPPYFEESSVDEVWSAAEALGARCVNILFAGRRSQITLDDVAEVFARICDQAAERGMIATVEFALRSIVNGFANAVDLCERTGRSNAGICLDTWAVHWGGDTLEALAAPGAGAYVGTIQVNDAPAERPDDLNFATRYQRLAPGYGAVDLAGMVRALRAGGCTAPLVAEVFNDAMLAELGQAGMAEAIASGLSAIEG